MTARDAILASIRAADVPPSAAATIAHAARPDTDVMLAEFFTALAAVGGRGILQAAGQSREQLLADLADERGDWVVVIGRFAVAENGAVYVDAADLADRADIVRAERLVLVVRRDAIVATMHEAVRLLPTQSACGWFLSGPSKTADIEQALVIGAQGARAVCVALIN